MVLPTLAEIEAIRRQGYRPEVAVAVRHEQKTLFLYRKEHDLWQFIQGGIEPGESVSMAAFRESAEELGEAFAGQLRLVGIIHTDKLLLNHQEERKLALDNGQEIDIVGKYFYCVLMEASGETVNLDDTEFDEYAWLESDRAIKTAEGVYQKGKRRIMLTILEKIENL